MSTFDRIEHVFPRTCSASECHELRTDKFVSFESIYELVSHAKKTTRQLKILTREMQKSSGTMHPDIRARIDEMTRDAEHLASLFKYIRIYKWMKDRHAVLVKTEFDGPDNQ